MGLRLLIIKPSSFGDIVHIFPALELIKRYFPDAEADFVVNPEFAGLLEFSPLPIRKKIIFERKKLAKAASFLPEFYRLVRNLRQEKYDYVIDFQGLFRSGICTFAARGKIKAGFADCREKSAAFAYNCRFAIGKAHAVERCVRLVQKIFALPDEVVPQVTMPVSAAGKAALPELPANYIVLLPGTRWESKRFPTSLFTGISLRIPQLLPGMGIVVAGSKGEKAIADEIGGDPLNLAGMTTLESLFELLRNASCVIGNDSGPLHAAAALGVPVFGFYGPTLPGLTGPWGDNTVTVSNGCECAGCLQRICPLPEQKCHQIDTEKLVAMIVSKIKENQP